MCTCAASSAFFLLFAIFAAAEEKVAEVLKQRIEDKNKEITACRASVSSNELQTDALGVAEAAHALTLKVADDKLRETESALKQSQAELKQSQAELKETKAKLEIETAKNNSLENAKRQTKAPALHRQASGASVTAANRNGTPSFIDVMGQRDRRRSNALPGTKKSAVSATGLTERKKTPPLPPVRTAEHAPQNESLPAAPAYVLFKHENTLPLPPVHPNSTGSETDSAGGADGGGAAPAAEAAAPNLLVVLGGAKRRNIRNEGRM